MAPKNESEMNGGNIRLRISVNVGCLSLASAMNDGNIRLYDAKINVGFLSLT